MPQLDEQAALDGFETLSPNGRPLDARDIIATVGMKLGREVRPGRRGRKPRAGRMDRYGEFESCPRDAGLMPP
jgi:hypothetical protein